MRRSLTVAIAALALWALAAGSASAHALLQSADPAPNAIVATAPASVTLTFTEAPDPKLSIVRLLDGGGQLRSGGGPTAVAGHPDELRLDLPQLPDGVYTVSWRTVSAVDGHVAAGSYAFSIGTGPVVSDTTRPGLGTATAAGVLPGSPGASPTTILGRWLLYIGLFSLLGVAFVASVLRGGGTGGLIRTPIRPAIGGLVVATAGTLMLVLGQLDDAGASLSALPGSSLGLDLELRLAPLAVAAVLLAVSGMAAGRAPGGERLRRWSFAGAGVTAAAALLVEADLSHAASEPQATVQIGIQWLHLVAVGLWLGGLAALLVDLRGAESMPKAQVARRFATLAGFGLAIVVATGILRAIDEVGSIDALFSTDFGRLVLLKSALLVPLALLGALNHFRNVPSAHLSLVPLRRSGTVELAIGAFVLLVAAQLVNIAPPTEVAAAAPPEGSRPTAQTSPTPASLEVNGSDYGTTVRLRLTISPGTVGVNAFHASVIDYDTRASVDASAVRLTFSQPARPDLGSSTLRLERQTDGTFAGSGANLSLIGEWQIAALISEPTRSVEVDLALTVQSSRQQVDVNREAGLPTIYTVHLGSGRTVQIYLDPGTPGPNLLHATWFDQSGHEMPVSDVTMTELLPSGQSVDLLPQILDSGHEAAPVQVAGLPASFDIGAVGPGGAALQVQLQIAQSS